MPERFQINNREALTIAIGAATLAATIARCSSEASQVTTGPAPNVQPSEEVDIYPCIDKPMTLYAQNDYGLK